jgi:hypothetical protein
VWLHRFSIILHSVALSLAVQHLLAMWQSLSGAAFCATIFGRWYYPTELCWVIMLHSAALPCSVPTVMQHSATLPTAFSDAAMPHSAPLPCRILRHC